MLPRRTATAIALMLTLTACNSGRTKGDPDVYDPNDNAEGGATTTAGAGGSTTSDAATTTGSGGQTSTGTGNNTPATCGDGAIDLGEECDGTDMGGATCDSMGLGAGSLSCTNECLLDASGCAVQPTCGDGHIGPGEECDDSNDMPLDGCDATCQFEGSACVPRWTPGVADEGAEACVCATDPYCCDNAWDEICVKKAIDNCQVSCGDPCSAHANPGSSQVQVTKCVCDIDVGCCDTAWGQGCAYIAENDCGACAANAVCGNGALESGEQCDDGNTTGGDGCSANCVIEVATCGNGVLEGNEECDDNGTTSGDGCSSSCQFEGNACVPRATPGVLNEAIEQCVCGLDSFCCSNAWDSLCVQQAIDDCNVNCGDECTAHSGPGSNDPQVTQCVCAIDDFCCEFSWDSSCVTVAQNSCSACAPPVCGNAILEPGEQCDDGNVQSNDGCDANCAIENAICGNGDVEQGEECDDDNTTSGDGCSSSCQFEGFACVPHSTPGVADEAVEACVCAADSFCCDNAWDTLCVSEAMSLCNVSCGDECSAHGNPGSESISVTQCVCAIDDWCCENSWDSFCVATATNSCGACGGVCGNGTLEVNEECDDGNTDADDGCSATCQFEGNACVPRSTPGVDDENIEACVCNQDSWCCDNSWDNLCVNLAQNSCGAGCGHPCTSHGGVGSSDPVVTSCTCDLDPYCCETAWDALCVTRAESSCNLSCAAGN